MNEVRKACYLCTTPLQVLGAIDLVLNLHQKADIFLFDDFADYKEVGERLSKTDIFENVYCVDFYHSLIAKKGIWVRAQIFFRMMFSQRYLGSIIGKNISYKLIYNSTGAVSKMVVGNALYRRNERMECVRYDEGVGSYSKSSKGKKGSPLFQKAKSLLGWKELVDEAKCFYLYEPELATDTEVEIIRMPTIDLNESNKNKLNYIFCGEANCELTFQEKAIIFDTYRINKDDESIKELDKIYQVIADSIGYKNVIMKAHPRSTVESIIDVKKYQAASIPIEMAYMQQTDLGEKILIALNSTAVFTPKMLFNTEPRIILLYRLINKDPSIKEKRDQTYLKMATMYTDRSRITIPNSLEELTNQLSGWEMDILES